MPSLKTQTKSQVFSPVKGGSVKEAPRTIEGSTLANRMMAARIERRLAIVLDRLQCSGEDGEAMKDIEPQGILAQLDKTSDYLSESMRLLYNIESVIGIDSVVSSRDSEG